MDKHKKKNVQYIFLSFKTSGGEFQYFRLNKEEAGKLLREHTENETNFLESNLNGGETFNETIWSGSYGPSLNHLSLTNEENGKKVDLNLCEIKQKLYCDGESDYQPNCLDFFYVTEGKVFGHLVIPIQKNEEFNPENLSLQYVEYNLDGYPERYGRILDEVTYNGQTCDIVCEDNGLDVFRSLIGYDMEGGELFDYFVVHDTEHSPEWNWAVLTEIFK